MAASPNDYDAPWKEALEHYLPDFLALLLPELHRQIDWTHPPVFLDKELQAIARGAANGRRIADKLVLVQLHHVQGRALRLLIHIEVQGGRIDAMSLLRMGERMYRYFYRISDHYLLAHSHRGQQRLTQRLAKRGGKGHPGDTDHMDGMDEAELLSLCILTAGAGGPPTLTYQQGYAGHGVQFSCPVIYLAKWLRAWDELEHKASSNPFAVVAMAQLMAQRTRDDHPQRLASKTRIVRLLYQHQYSRADVLNLFRLIDWMMALPPELEPAFGQAMETIEQEYKMAFVTSIERLGQQKGRQEGRQEGEAALLQRLLARKFGALSEALQHRIQSATPAQLETWSLNILDATSLDEVFTD